MERNQALWKRLDAIEEAISLVDYCRFGFPLTEGLQHPCSDAESGFKYLKGFPRILLRHTPLLAVGFLLVEIRLFMLGGGNIPPFIQEGGIALLGFLVLSFLVDVLDYQLAGEQGSKDRRSFWHVRFISYISKMVVIAIFVSISVYFILLHLTITFEVLTTYVDLFDTFEGKAMFNDVGDGVNAEYALLLLVGGYLVYDGLQRTETLFWHLGDSERYHFLVHDYDYQTILSDSASVLQWYNPSKWFNGRSPPNGPMQHWYRPARLAGIFGMIVVLISLLISFQSIVDSIELSTSTLFVVFSIIDETIIAITRALLFIVAINFVILVAMLRKFAENDNNFPTLRFHPYHPDELGGFRDIGKFATRVNVILILGGIYAVYRMIILDITDPIVGVLPIIIYGGVTITWFYLSFWKLHLRMVDGIRKWLTEGGNPSDEPTIGGFQDEPSWDEIRALPRWPVSSSRLTQLTTANLAPVVLGLFEIIQPF